MNKPSILSRVVTAVLLTAGVGGLVRPAIAADTDANQSSTTNGQPRKGTALEEVTVMAQRTTEALARDAEFTAPNLVNLTTAEEIKRLPDVNAGEAIARLPGISLETDTGEGRFINIRGLDSDLNSTTFGGQRMPPSSPASPFAGGRAVAFDSIPIGFVGALLITKTNLPEQDAEALGGTIDITPKTVPADGKPFANLRLGGGYEELRSTGITDLSATAGGRFGGDGTYQPFSILVTGTYHEDKRGIDDIEPSYADAPPAPDKAFSDIQQRYYQYNRKRHGYGIDLGYDPDASNHYYARFFDTGYTETVYRNILRIQPQVNYVDDNTVGIDPANPNNYIDNFKARKTMRDEKETLDAKIMAIGGKNEIGDNVLDYRLGYVKGSWNKPYDYNSTFKTSSTGVITYDNISNPNFARYTFSGFNPADPSTYKLTGMSNFTGDVSDDETSFNVNLLMPTSWTSGAKESLKIGANARLRKREYSTTAFNADLTGVTLPLSAAATGNNVSFYLNNYQNGPQISQSIMRNLWASVPHIGYELPDGSEPDYFQKDKEDVYAVYGQYSWTSGPLGLVGGVRIEQTAATYYGNSWDVNTSVVTPLQQNHNYTNLFPSVQMRYELDKDLIVRGALSTTIARPGFNQVNPTALVDSGALTVTTGNPNLKPAKAVSFDLSITKELSHEGVLSVGLFDKEISDYIIPYTSRLTVAGFEGLGPLLATTYANASKSYSRGLEFNYVQRLKDVLPGALGNIGYALNYTHVDSAVRVIRGDLSTDTVGLPSSSPDTANATLMYETKALELTLGAMYVGRNLFGYGGGPGTDVYSQHRLSVDFGANYKVNSTLGVYFNAKNLTNTPLKFTEGVAEDRPIQREFYKATYLAGITLDF
jgi:TonB-dependent receptor